jgi:hypothetical protein
VPAGDIATTKQFTSGQLGVDGPDLNAIIGQSSIQTAFFSAQSSASGPGVNDLILLLQSGGAYAKVLYSNFFTQAAVRAAVGLLSPVTTICNGDMAVNQMVGPYNNVTAGQYTLDRYRTDYVMATGKINITQTDTAGSLVGGAFNHRPRYCLRATVATLQASLLSGEYFLINQRIELEKARKLFDGVHSLSLWVRTSVAGSYGVSIHNADASQFYKQTVSIGSPNVWQRIAIPNIPVMPTATGSWGTAETDFSYVISVCLGCGVTFQSTQENAWNNGNFFATASQTNLLATNAATFDMCLVQHEPGAVCTSFAPMDFDETLWQCQRYLCKTYSYATAPGTNTGVSSGYVPGLCYTGFLGNFIGGWKFPNVMRAVPTAARCHIYSTDGSADAVRDVTNSANRTVTAPIVATDSGFSQFTMGTNSTAGSFLACHGVFDAEI